MAEDDPSVEQRVQIVDLILRLWTNRTHLPSPAPLAESNEVVAGLERLGDSSPWGFSRLGLTAAVLEQEASSHLVSTALELEQLMRSTILRLIWLAARDAGDIDGDWLALGEQVGLLLEPGVLAEVRRLFRDSEGVSNLELPELGLVDDRAEGEFGHLSAGVHAARLREMASRLSQLADELEGPDG